MTPNTIAGLPRSRGLLSVVNLLGLGLALGLASIVLGYAAVDPPEISLLWASEASALAHASHPSRAVAHADPTSATSAASERRVVAPEPADARTGGPTECAPDEGVADACIYN